MRKSLLLILPAVALAACSGADPIEPNKDFDKGDPNAGSAISAPAFEAVEYPAGPYGTQVDSIMANFEFLGWKAPAAVGYDTSAIEKVSMADFYDPTGEKGIKVIMLNASAVWCTVCRAEYKKFDTTYKALTAFQGVGGKQAAKGSACCDACASSCANGVPQENKRDPAEACAGLQGVEFEDCLKQCHAPEEPQCVKLYNYYHAEGAEFVSALFEDGKNPPEPAKPKDMQWWGDTYNVEFPMVIDPGFKLGRFFTADATPMNLLIDAKTMKIVGKYLGGDTTAMFKQLDSML